MVNKRDVEMFIVCLSCHFDVGLSMSSGMEVPRWRFSMIRVYVYTYNDKSLLGTLSKVA
jgi:hypothetical protein